MASATNSVRRSLPAAKELFDAVDRLALDANARAHLYDLISNFHTAIVEDFREALGNARDQIKARRARS